MQGVYVHTKLSKTNVVRVSRLSKEYGITKGAAFNLLIEMGLQMKKGTKKAAPKAKPMPKAKPSKKK